MTRYYFHGYQSEDSQEKYYCAKCDLFTDLHHFDDHEHSATNKERYDLSLSNWKVISKRKGSRLQRPNKPTNLFSNSKKPIKSQFYRWLQKQLERDDPISDLAHDAKGDSGFPSNTNSLSSIKGYLFSKLASNEAIQALEEAHSEFKNNKKTRSGLTLSLRFNVFRRDDYKCQICGATAKDGVRLEVDHKVPVAKGGTDDMSNLWTLCFNCNRGKGKKNL